MKRARIDKKVDKVIKKLKKEGKIISLKRGYIFLFKPRPSRRGGAQFRLLY